MQNGLSWQDVVVAGLLSAVGVALAYAGMHELAALVLGGMLRGLLSPSARGGSGGGAGGAISTIGALAIAAALLAGCGASSATRSAACELTRTACDVCTQSQELWCSEPSRGAREDLDDTSGDESR
jgi:hypothetical protein